MYIHIKSYFVFIFKRGKLTGFHLFLIAQKLNLLQKSSDSEFTFFLLCMEVQKKLICIDKYRYLSFVKNIRKNNRVRLPYLLLLRTSVSACQHVYRVYYQVELSLGNQLDPENESELK